MFKISVFFVLALHLWLTLEVHSSTECPSDTRCIKLTKCPFYVRNYQHSPDIPYCRKEERGTRVCCPQPTLSYIRSADENIRSVRECRSYQQYRQQCDEPLIAGGEPAKPKEFPFMALVFIKTENVIKWLCGGTLISSRFVLTAAHCFYDSKDPNMVRLGELDYSRSDDDANPIDIAIKNYTVHPAYNYFDNFNDIALIELEHSVQFSDYIMPACLPLANSNRVFKEFTTAGWGLTSFFGSASSHLQKVTLDLFEENICMAKVGKSSLNTTTQICAGSFNDIRDTCKGDSGGPLFITHPNYKCMFLIFGITSYGEGGCSNVGYPAMYTRVSAFIDWIDQKVWG